MYFPRVLVYANSVSFPVCSVRALVQLNLMFLTTRLPYKEDQNVLCLQAEGILLKYSMHYQIS